ncbi:hypothetical protein [Paralcaligenes ginsengisoli]
MSIKRSSRSKSSGREIKGYSYHASGYARHKPKRFRANNDLLRFLQKL